MREELECEDIIHEIDSHFMREELEPLSHQHVLLQ